MKTISVYCCEKCGKIFEYQEPAVAHEKRCLPLKKGQKVSFQFGLSIAVGQITALHKAEVMGAEPTVHIKMDKSFIKPSDGKWKLVWVTWDKVVKVVK